MLFTPRELDVLRLLLKAHSYKQIEQILGIGERTVEVHIRRILDKTNLKRCPQLIAKFYQVFIEHKLSDDINKEEMYSTKTINEILDPKASRGLPCGIGQTFLPKT